MLKKIRGLFGRRPKDSPSDSSDAVPAVHQGPQVVHRPIPVTDLDADAVKICERLTRFEHRAFLVGGCVRDLLLDRQPKDFDIGTSATPRQIKRVFRNCRIIGRRFRLAHIYFQNGKIIEVATFRSLNGDAANGDSASDDSASDDSASDDSASGDSASGDGDLMIRDDNEFGTPEQDALRRDFTINSLFYDLTNETVLDHAGGLDDLRRRFVRTIGDPGTRFSEDPIRILRAIKFAARLDFKIERKTLAALSERANEIPKAAAPRILEEINRYGREGAARRSFELLREHGVFDVILPELAAAYAADEAWSLLYALLDELDRRRGNDHDVSTGEILAVLLLPTLAKRLGWKAGGTAEFPKGLDIRKCVDDVLRPLALRLRVSRREQERSRQIIAILSRMVPVSHVRKSTRRAILRRINFLDALWILEVCAKQFGDQFQTAVEEWSTGRSEAIERREARAADDRQKGTGRPEGREGSGGRGRRGGRRRGGRGRKTTQQPSARAAQPRQAPKAQPPRDPKNWDDDYFFSALPTAPAGGHDDRGDRYGAGELQGDDRPRSRQPADDGADGEKHAHEDGQDGQDSEAAPRRRRRRRRRKRRGTGGGDQAAAVRASDDGDSGQE